MARTIVGANGPVPGMASVEAPETAPQDLSDQDTGGLRPVGGRRLPTQLPVNASLPLGPMGRNFPTLPGRGRRIMGTAPGTPPPVTGPQLGAMLSPAATPVGAPAIGGSVSPVLPIQSQAPVAGAAPVQRPGLINIRQP